MKQHDDGPSLGEYEENYARCEGDGPTEPPKDPRDAVWTTREGQRIRVGDMETGHLRNAVAMLERNAERIVERALLAMLMGPRPHGEMAQDAFEMEFDDLSRQEPHDVLPILVPAYAAMVAELSRRARRKRRRRRRAVARRHNKGG